MIARLGDWIGEVGFSIFLVVHFSSFFFSDVWLTIQLYPRLDESKKRGEPQLQHPCTSATCGYYKSLLSHRQSGPNTPPGQYLVWGVGYKLLLDEPPDLLWALPPLLAALFVCAASGLNPLWPPLKPSLSFRTAPFWPLFDPRTHYPLPVDQASLSNHRPLSNRTD